MIKLHNVKFQSQYYYSCFGTGLIEPQLNIPMEGFYEHYSRIASTHPGMIVVEPAFVHMSGEQPHPQLSLAEDSFIKYHQKLIQQIKDVDKNVIVCCQLSHCGSKHNGPDKIVFNQASINELNGIVDSFISAAKRAHSAGYDLIVLNAQASSLLDSSLESQRKDKYEDMYVCYLGITYMLPRYCSQILPTGIKISDPNQYLLKIPFDFVEVCLSKNQPESPRASKPLTQDIVKQLSKQVPFLLIRGGVSDLESAKKMIWSGAKMVGFSRNLVRNWKFLEDPDGPQCTKCNGCLSKLTRGQVATCIYE